MDILDKLRDDLTRSQFLNADHMFEEMNNQRNEAAQEIERLRSELNALKDALFSDVLKAKENSKYKDDVIRLNKVRDRQKREWGVSLNVSFDDVWKEALSFKDKVEAMQWRPISEAPKDGTRILTTQNNYPDDIFCDRYVTEQNRWGYDSNPTHWMPLPPAPEE